MFRTSCFVWSEMSEVPHVDGAEYAMEAAAPQNKSLARRFLSGAGLARLRSCKHHWDAGR